MLNIALPKGRLGENAYALIADKGVIADSRKLIFSDEKNNLSYFWVKPSDVAAYVESGAADAGIVGKDVIEETSPDVYELLDLGIGRCRMCVAAKNSYVEDSSRPLTVATKFVNTARRFFALSGRKIAITELHGSIELAPITGLADVIVDIVETGTTLKENDLSVIAVIADISTRLIANKAAYKFKNGEMLSLIAKLKKSL